MGAAEDVRAGDVRAGKVAASRSPEKRVPARIRALAELAFLRDGFATRDSSVCGRPPEDGERGRKKEAHMPDAISLSTMRP
jgi:hypothetical protein